MTCRSRACLGEDDDARGSEMVGDRTEISAERPVARLRSRAVDERHRAAAPSAGRHAQGPRQFDIAAREPNLLHCTSLTARSTSTELACESAANDASCADEPASVARASECHDLDEPPRLRRVHHPTASDVETDVAEPGEEEQVSCPQPRERHSPSCVVQCVRAVREGDPEAPVRPGDEPGAIETGARGASSPPIGNAHSLHRDPRRPLAERRLKRRSFAFRLGQRGRVLDRAAKQKHGECEREHAAAEAGRHKERGTTGRAGADLACSSASHRSPCRCHGIPRQRDIDVRSNPGAVSRHGTSGSGLALTHS
jgi:hypothetical protein